MGLGPHVSRHPAAVPVPGVDVNADPPGPTAGLVYIASAVVYATFVSNMFELGENMRFRFETDPVIVAVAAALIGWVWRRRKAATAGAIATRPAS